MKGENCAMRKRILIEIREVGVDWITVTARDPEKVERLRTFVYSLLECEAGKGNLGKPWFQSGYVGLSCGHVQFGERDDGVIARLGGCVAKDYWMRLMELADNVSRFDLQATCKVSENVRELLDRHFRQIQRRRREMRRAPRLSRVMEDEGGYTIYTGRKISNVFGRIYDKFHESKQDYYRGCVRYEVQFNGKRAKWVSSVVRANRQGLREIALAVFEFFADRGCSCRRLLELLKDTVSIDTGCPPAKPSDVAIKLEWLFRSVRPTVILLNALGLSDTVHKTLGLTQDIEIPCSALA